MKPVIVVGDYKRPDLQFYLEAIGSKYEVYLLQLDIASSNSSPHKKSIGTEISISNYRHADHLIKTLNISKVFFFALENIHEVLFNISAKNIGIPTVHLEHGVRDYETTVKFSIQRGEGTKKSFFRISLDKILGIRQIKKRIALKNFFDKSLASLPKEKKDFMIEYVKIRKSTSFLETCRVVNDPLRLPDSYISFSPKVFEFHKIKDHLKDQEKVSFIGFPQFDELQNLEIGEKQEIIFIDQPFAELNLFGWTSDFKFQLIQRLHDEIAEKYNYAFKIKPHPNSNLQFWENCENSFELLKLVDEKNMYSNDIVIGFGSTMLLPLVAQDETVCFSLEIHPKIDFEYSKFLTSSEAIEQVNSIEDLKKCISDLEEYRSKQNNEKSHFVSEWLYEYDGNSYYKLLNVV